MNWDDIGMMVGYNLANGYFRNQHDRWVDEGRKALKDMANVSDADRRNAKGFLQGAIDRNGFIGQDPRLLYLQQKQGYMQAANDKRYLLDNGYAADSEDVKGFDAKMAAAHRNADELRAYAKSAGFDYGNLGDGMNLQQLNHEVSRRQFPALYDESRYDISNHLPHDKRLWSDMGADYALGKTNTMPTFGAGGAQPTQEQAAAMEAVAAQAAPQAGAPQTLGVPGLAKPASELSSEELMQLLTGQPNFKADPFGLRGADGGVKNTASVPNQITAESIYKYLQSIGQIDKKVDYNAAIDELAKAFAEERVKRMTDDDKREYLVSHGIGNDIASIVIPEANAKAREKARQEAIAQMAQNATNPMMAQALAMMALTDGAKPGDFMDAIRSTKPEMGFHDIDLGGTKMQTMYDKNGWLNPQAAQFVKTVSPDALLTNQTRYDTTKMQQENANWRKQYEQENANWRAQYRGQNGGSGGRAAGGKGGEKLTQAQQHFLNEFSNRYLAAKQAITDGYSEDDHGLQELTDFLYDDGRKMLSPEDFRKFEAYVYALQGYMWKQHAIDDPTDENAENQAMEHWRHVPPEILEEVFPGYNFDAYK